MQMAHLDLHLLAQLLVEGRQRLVHQQDARLEDDGAGQRHALPLAAGQLVHLALAEPRELDHVERRRTRSSISGCGQTPRSRRG